MEPEWRRCKSRSTGKWYFFNVKTNASTYERPADYEEPTATISPFPQHGQVHGREGSESSEGRGRASRPRLEGLGDGGPQPQTVLAMFEDLREERLKAMLEPGRWRFVSVEEAVRTRYVDLVIVDGKHNYDRRLYHIKSRLKSRVDAELIANKLELHMHLAKFPDTRGLICESQLVTVDDAAPQVRVVDGEPWIWRPEGGWGGDGCAVYCTQEQVDAAQQALREAAAAQRRAPRRALLSRYIEDPLLVKGLKMNIRLYYVVVVEADGRRRAGLSREGMIGSSRKPYINSRESYGDMSIHDSRTLMKEDLNFPRDYPGDAEVFLDKASRVLASVSRHTLAHVKGYSESQVGFEVFGLDLMEDTAGRVYLIEINHKPGHKRIDEGAEWDWLSDVVFRGVCEFVLGQPPPQGTPPALIHVFPPRQTYLALMEQLDPGVLQASLGFDWERVTLDKAVGHGWTDLVFADGFKNFDRRLWTLKCGVKSRIEALQLTNKFKLTKMLQARAPNLIARSFTVSAGEPLELLPGVWIYRPNMREGGGAGVKVVTSQSELDAQRNLCEDRERKLEAVVSEYMVDPMLLRFGAAAYKFHLRIYYLVVLRKDHSKSRAAVFREGEMARASRPYQADDWENDDVHNTHLKTYFECCRRTGAAPLLFPRDFPQPDAAADVFGQIVHSLTTITSLVLPELHPYKESEHGFNLFGCDFMVDAATQVKLLEINATPSLERGAGTPANSPQLEQRLSRMVFEGIVDFALGDEAVRAPRHLEVCGSGT